MNAKFLAALVAAAFATPVFANNPDAGGDIVRKVGSDSRPETASKESLARDTSELGVNASPPPLTGTAAASKLSRAAVRAETIRARAAGELDLTEADRPVRETVSTSTLTRAEVRAEYIRARDAGELILDEAGTRSFKR